MKRYSIYISLLTITAMFFSSCSDSEWFDNKLFVHASSWIENLLIKGNVENEERTLQFQISQPVEYDINITYKADASLLKTYNEAYYDEAIILPAENYELPEPQVKIIAGSVLSTPSTIYFNNINQLDRDLTYVLPVTIANSNMDILPSASTTYYVFKGAALINVVADIEENYLHIGSAWTNPAVVNGLSQLTMEALFRARNFDREITTIMGIEGKFLIRIGDANFPSNQIQIATSGGNFPSADTNKGLPTNEWVHVALTYDATEREMKVYVNGNVQSEGTINAGNVNLGVGGVDGFYIGRSYSDTRFLAGEISECRIWNIVRTKEEIANNIYEVEPDTEGLVAYWKCNEGGGNIVNDHTGNGNNLTAKEDVNIKWTPVSLPASNK